MDDVWEWQQETFGVENMDLSGLIAHLYREIGELDRSMVYGSEADRPGEMADILIICRQVCGLLGWDMAEIVSAKLKKVRTRKWLPPDKDGVVEHVRGGDL